MSGAALTSVGQRRRRNTAALIVMTVLVGMAAAVGAAFGDSERITGFWAGAELSRGGGAEISEVIDYDFAGDSRHGIFRDVPGLSTDAAVSVTMDSKPVRFTLIGQGAKTRIRIGDPAHTVSGQHRYRIRYPLGTLVRGDVFAWNAVGTDWQVPLSHIEVQVAAPFAFTGTRCVQGASGSRHSCAATEPAPGRLAVRLGALDAGQGATLSARTGRTLAAAPALPRPGAAVVGSEVDPLLTGLPAAAAALIAAVAVTWLLRRAGRERVAADPMAKAASAATGREKRVDAGRLAATLAPRPHPPAGLDPAQGGVLLQERIEAEHKMAWLINAALDGHLEIQGTTSRPVLVRRKRPDAPAADPATKTVLNTLFRDGRRVTLGSYDKNVAYAWDLIGDSLQEWRRTCGLWDPAGERRSRIARRWGAVAALAGLALTVISAVAARTQAAWPVYPAACAAVTGAGLALWIRAWELRVRTAQGTALWLQAEGFRRFLAESAPQQSKAEAETAKLEQYTAWAVALGLTKRWCAALETAPREPSGTAPRPTAAPGAVRPPMYDLLMARSMLSSISASTAQPSSSGSGGGTAGGGSSSSSGSGFDGGSVGSGGGGGGGGSW